MWNEDGDGDRLLEFVFLETAAASTAFALSDRADAIRERKNVRFRPGEYTVVSLRCTAPATPCECVPSSAVFTTILPPGCLLLLLES